VYIWVGSPQLDPTKMVVMLPLSNSGRTPTGSVEVIIHEATIDVAVPDAQAFLNAAVERYWKRYRSFSKSRGANPISIGTPLPAASPAPECCFLEEQTSPGDAALTTDAILRFSPVRVRTRREASTVTLSAR
jgi:hypothetical protein